MGYYRIILLCILHAPRHLLYYYYVRDETKVSINMAITAFILFYIWLRIYTILYFTLSLGILKYYVGTNLKSLREPILLLSEIKKARPI